MPVLPPYQPQNLSAEQSDGNILLTWAGALGATSYQVQRSLDSVNFTNLATTLTPQYIDVLPGLGIMYTYQILAVNVSGSSIPSVSAQMVAAPPSEMSLYELRLRSQQAADRVGSDFVTTSEWNAFIRLSMYELYDLLIGSYEDLFSSSFVFINTNGTQQNYAIPDGVTNFIGGVYPNPLPGQPGSLGHPLVPGLVPSIAAPGSPVPGIPAPAQYKIVGMDLGVNTSNNAWVTLLKYDFIERNRYVYPNSTSTIYGVYNMRYREMGDLINIIPTPAGNQQVRMWYAPKLKGLLADTDLTTLGFSGWLRYVIVRASKYALDKEEGSDTSKQDTEIAFLKTRIEQMSQNRDIGEPDTISDTRRNSGGYGGNGWGGGGNQAGW
jgi:hypothetical protein